MLDSVLVSQSALFVACRINVNSHRERERKQQGFKAYSVAISSGIEVRDGRGRTYNHIIVAGVGDDLRRLDEDALVSHLEIAQRDGRRSCKELRFLPS